MIWAPQQISFGSSNQAQLYGRGTWHVFGRKKKCILDFGWEKYHLEDLGVDGRVILKEIFKKWGGKTIDWTDLAQYRDRWRALVDFSNEHSVSVKHGEFLD